MGACVSRGSDIAISKHSPRHVASHPPRPYRLWIDELPLEIRERIAATLCKARPTYNALCLAATSEKLCEAVLNALSFRLELSVNTEGKELWASLFRYHIRELVLNDWHHAYPLHLLKSPSLRRVKIPSTQRFLRAVSQARSLRALTVTFWPACTYVDLLDALEALDLTELRLIGASSIVNEMAMAKVEMSRLPALCPNVTVLEIDCGGQIQSPVWPIYAKFPELREVTLNQSVPDEAVPMLRFLCVVNIFNIHNGVRLASRIGNPVKSVIHFSLVERAELSALSQCGNLSQLYAFLDHGAEEELPKVATSLRSLLLRWGLLRPPGTWKFYHAAEPGTMLRVVKQAPELRELRLHELRISSDELVAMLRLLGTQLEVFGTSVDGQEEAIDKRLTRLLVAIGNHNDGLRKVEFTEKIFPPMPVRLPSDVMFARRRRLTAAYERVGARAPLLDTDELATYIEQVKQSLRPLYYPTSNSAMGST